MDLQDFLLENASWALVNGVLTKKFDFRDYEEVVSFVNRVADLAEALNHHPTVTFSYNWVKVETVTHDQGDIVTEKDIELAKEL